MARFEAGVYVQVIATGRIGEVIGRERTTVIVEFSDEFSIDPEVYDFKNHELKVVELPRLKTSQLKLLVKGEITVAELTNGVNLIPPHVEVDSKAYKVTAADLLAGVENYIGMPPEDVYRWVEAVITFSDDMYFPDNSWENIEEAVTEKDILAYAFDELENLRWMILDYDPIEMEADDFKELKDLLEIWIDSEGKEYPDAIKFKIVQQYDSDNIDKQSEATQQLFKECLDYYCGTKVYPNDWMKARDAFIDYYQLTGDASAANTLGYTFYYGRCNGGVPEYEEAFKYFSIGHAYSYFESTYKLADMFTHGYGVVKDGESANYLCDDKTVVEGDFVVVNGYDGEKVVKVVAVSDKYNSELGLPIEKYKRIVRKAGVCI